MTLSLADLTPVCLNLRTSLHGRFVAEVLDCLQSWSLSALWDCCYRNITALGLPSDQNVLLMTLQDGVRGRVGYIMGESERALVFLTSSDKDTLLKPHFLCRDLGD